MIGNDVIDLALAKTESNWKRKGFLDKVFSVSEQLLIDEAENPEVMVWSLWSRKEAVYKIINRETKIRTYNPLQFECRKMDFLEGIYFGVVVHKSVFYFTKTAISSHSIHTVAVSDLNDFGKINALTNRGNIIKKEGIPWIYDSDKSSKKPVSISHHGRFERIVSL